MIAPSSESPSVDVASGPSAPDYPADVRLAGRAVSSRQMFSARCPKCGRRKRLQCDGDEDGGYYLWCKPCGYSTKPLGRYELRQMAAASLEVEP